MSSTIKLYEHNQKAYDALLDMLGERDRACVIKPTGTGKFVIIAKMVQDNPDKRFLLLGTNDYMFNDQMANLAEIAPGFTPENLQFMTYAAAMGMERRNDCVPPYDVIIADEFHHCGAEEWGKGVTHILNANESAKVVGFTATPIRYSDGGRNMADEMFDGNVAYSMELEEAWLRGILPIPEYIVALYEAPSELEKLAKSITTVRDEVARKRFQKKYEKLRRALTEAGGVREAIAAYLKKANRDGTEPFNGRREPRWTGRFDISSTGGAFGSVLQRARVMTETTRISAMEIRMSLANTRTPRKRSRRRKHSYRRMGTRSMTRKMASAPSSTGL